MDLDKPMYEIALLTAMKNRKPVGTEKHFRMIGVLEEFCRLTHEDVSSEMIFRHLAKSYDMRHLNNYYRDEFLESPLARDVVEFKLPDEIQNYRDHKGQNGVKRASDETESEEENKVARSRKNLRLDTTDSQESRDVSSEESGSEGPGIRGDTTTASSLSSEGTGTPEDEEEEDNEDFDEPTSDRTDDYEPVDEVDRSSSPEQA